MKISLAQTPYNPILLSFFTAPKRAGFLSFLTGLSRQQILMKKPFARGQG